MSKEYTEKKIKEALALHNGNIARTRKQIIKLAAEDSDLLYALTRPHLDGIIAYQVDRVASGRAELEKRHPQAEKSKATSPTSEENFGMDLLRAVATSEAAVFGQQNPMGNRRKTASKQHIDAIRQIVSGRVKKD